MACRHLAAALYELEAFEIKSCTEGENKWAKRPRHHDVPVPIHNLIMCEPHTIKLKQIGQCHIVTCPILDLKTYVNQYQLTAKDNSA